MSFIEAFPALGFDGNGSYANAPWQYVPRGGTRLVAIQAGWDAKLVNNFSGLFQVFEVYSDAPPAASSEVKLWSPNVKQARSANSQLSNARFFVVKGKAAGIGKFYVGLKWLNVEVAELTPLPVRLHFVKGLKENLQTARGKNQALAIVAEANKILEPQTGVSFTSLGAESLGINQTLGFSVFHDLDQNDNPVIVKSKTRDTTHFITNSWLADAAVNCFFVWRIASAKAGSTTPDAVAIRDRCMLISDTVSKSATAAGRALAHEFIHNCGYAGHDLSSKSIMYDFNYAPAAILIGRNHTEMIRNWINQPW